MADLQPNKLLECRRPPSSAALRKGDVLLVEGSSRFSTAVKYLTQSTWSHTALYVSDSLSSPDLPSGGGELVEGDLLERVRRVSLSTYWDMHTRICRPVGLKPQEIDEVVEHSVSAIGHQYDLKLNY